MIPAELMDFELGQLMATPGALAAFERTADDPAYYLDRHASNDWGDLDEHDREMNDDALTSGDRIFSAYHLNDGTKIYVITEAKSDDGTRAATTIMLPEEY